MKKEKLLTPKDIDTNYRFMGSPLQNSESETILRNIVLQQKKKDLDNWTPFTWQDYKDACTHKASDKEKGVLDALTNGGKPVWNTSVNLVSGWLVLVDEKYTLTERTIKMLSKEFPIQD